MKKNDGVAQPLLANIDLLLTIAGKYPAYANLIIKKVSPANGKIYSSIGLNVVKIIYP